MRVYGVAIKDTESCPWNNNKGCNKGGCGYRQFRDKELWQYYECTGIGSKHCPLILIEPWRLESCETCGRNSWGSFYEGCNDIYQDDDGLTCKNWEPK